MVNKTTTNNTTTNKADRVNTKAMIKLLMNHMNDESNGGSEKKVKQYEVRHFLDGLASCIYESLRSSKAVFLPKVGVVEIHNKKATRRRNPQNGEFINIPHRRAIKCRFFKSFSSKALDDANTNVKHIDNATKSTKSKTTKTKS